MYEDPSDARPPGLRRRAVAANAVFWRIDGQAPDLWDWKGFPEPRNRFDPASGGFRVRYAALALPGAFRERYLATGRYVPADHRSHRIVRLEALRPLRILDLRTEANLDALGVDDRISTGREGEVWRTAHRLSDAARRWWSDLDGLLYRSRTTPSSSVNLAFFGLEPFRYESRDMHEADDLLTDLVLSHGFTFGWDLRAVPSW